MTSPPPDPPLASPALERLVRENQTSVWRYLRFLGCTPDVADDLTQETFLAVLGRRLERFRPEGARAYLRRVARNAFLKRCERANRRPEVDLDTAEAAFAWYERDDRGVSTAAALECCLAELSEQARRALTLRYAGQLDRRALAARLGIGPHGVKSLLQRSYARLRVCIERRLRDDRA